MHLFPNICGMDCLLNDKYSSVGKAYCSKENKSFFVFRTLTGVFIKNMSLELRSDLIPGPTLLTRKWSCLGQIKYPLKRSN